MPKTNPPKATVRTQGAVEPPPLMPTPFAVRVATLGGIGKIPWAPGTFGSLMAVGLVAAFDRIPFVPGIRAAVLCLAIGAIFGIGVVTARRSEIFLRQVDPGQVVIDELAGQLLAFLFEPTGSWKLLLAGFVAFRTFDIWKPFPARQAERLGGGWGIMMDDVIAGVYALAVVMALSYLLR